MKKLKIGIFGLFRGMEYVRQFSSREDTEVIAILEKKTEYHKDALPYTGKDVKFCKDYNELLSSGIDAVYLANYLPDHAKCAIEAMERGIDVLSECLCAATLKECVELWECVERTGRKYMLAENAPFVRDRQELKRIYEGGTLGKLLYAEAEYNHYTDRETKKYAAKLSPEKYHWRKYLPRTYYLTHTLGLLMYATGEVPVNVSAFGVKFMDGVERPVEECMSSMLCKTDKGSMFRFSGCNSIVGGNGYRLVGENGLVEFGRGYGQNISLIYKDYLIPEGRYEKQLYKPGDPECDEEIKEASHGGADFFVAKDFADYVLRDKYPYFDYKNGILMSVVAIMGHRSLLDNGNTIPIPDFSKKEVRDQYRADDSSPFPDEDGKANFPCTFK